ncbi:MAG: GntR family transcriptional regulator, partial [candidate division KSB1 bacterium]|nr:GntR family transcriptional regulator [candidate division KSB1 bacterium]
MFDRGADASLQTQLFDQLRGLILRGRLSAGVRVPSTRDLARQTGLSRNTINLAYERLIAEGYLETREGVGTFVTRHLPEDALRRRESDLDVSANSPHAAPLCGPLHRSRPARIFGGGPSYSLGFQRRPSRS